MSGGRKAPRELRSFALRARRLVTERMFMEDENADVPTPFHVLVGDARGAVVSAESMPVDTALPMRTNRAFAAAARRPVFLGFSVILAGGGENLRPLLIERVVKDGRPPSIGEAYEAGLGVPTVGLLVVDRNGAAMMRSARAAHLTVGIDDWGPGEILGAPWILDLQRAMAGRPDVPPLDMGQ